MLNLPPTFCCGNNPTVTNQIVQQSFPTGTLKWEREYGGMPVFNPHHLEREDKQVTSTA
jgi:hypothetical protein